MLEEAIGFVVGSVAASFIAAFVGFVVETYRRRGPPRVRPAASRIPSKEATHVN